MMGICGLRLRGILFLQALVGIVRMQVCQQEKHLAITSLTGGDVKFVSDHYHYFAHGPFRHEIVVRLYRRQQLDTPVATILPGPEGGFFYRQKNRKKVSGNVFMKKVGNSTNIFNFNATITIHNLSETDSDVYMLYRELVTLGCWSVYVLGEGKYSTNQDYFEEGTLIGVTEFFPHLSDEIAQNMTVNTTWQLDDREIDEHLPLLTTRDMNSKPLAYTIQGPGHSPMSIKYILNISYTGPVIFEPNRTSYVLPTDGTLQPITCIAYCNPTCEVKWKREGVAVSHDTILQPDSILPGISEYVCHVRNNATGKELRRRIFTYGLGEGKYSTNQDYFEEGTLIGVTEFFPHLSDEIAQNMSVNTTWQLDDREIDEHLPLLTTRDMNSKPLAYTIQGPGHSPISIKYILNISYTGPVIFEPNRTSYVLPTDGTLQPITCIAYCNPTCEVKWKREGVAVSHDAILQPDSVLSGISEYVCHVRNNATGKELRRRIFTYGLEHKGESKTLFFVFASLTGVFALVSTVLVVQMWRHGCRSCNKSRRQQRKPQTETVEMDAEPVADSAHDDNTDRPEVSYETLQSRSGQENTYDGICTENQQAEDMRTTYENF